MFGFDPLTISSMLLLAGGQISCPAHAPTKINIIPKTEEVKYDKFQTLKEIQAYQTDTVDPYSFHGKSVTQAFMQGSIQMNHSIKYGQSQNARYDAGCVWYDEINVTISIDPTIVVAKEIYADRCMRNAVLGHEIKHVQVDRDIVNQYARSIGQKLFDELKSRGFSAGPVHIKDMQSVADKMAYVVQQILELEYKKLDIERQDRQRAVDSLGEYERVDALCPDFKEKKAELYNKL